MDKILKVTKKLKTFTLEDIVMFSGIDTNSVREFLQQSENIKQVGNKFEYLEIIKVEDKFKDFYKIKQEMGLENYLFDDLRFLDF